jgi:predicted CXXCH cytochrome family protein
MRWISLAVRGLAVTVLLSTAAHLHGQATPVRQADAVCAKCHAEISRTYLATSMANASGRALEKLKPDTFAHPASGVTYEVSNVEGKAELEYRTPQDPAWPHAVVLSYFLGSGHLATTYLYSIDKYLFESPVAWYAASKSYDMKPGMADMREVVPPLPMQSSCLRCHMSAVQSSEAGTVNRYDGLAFLHTGITCEACHGDTRQHVATGGKAAVVNPAKLDADRRDSVCVSCHLEGDVTVERAGKSALDYQPGEPISKYLAYFVRVDANLTARGVSEVEQLSQSTCKRMSGDRMSCTSCHDPHFTPDPEQKAAFFRSKCLACHSEPSFAATHHPENPDCTSCHMRRLAAGNILHVAWTDHRLLRVPEGEKAESAMAGASALKAIFSPGTTERDEAMAEYQLLMEGDRAFETLAWEHLSQLRSAIQQDPAALDALGNVSAERGDAETAETAFRRVLTIDAEDLTARSNLGVLLAREGKTEEAIDILRNAFERNQYSAGLAMNLARVECMAGNSVAAQDTLKTALKYSPEQVDMRRLLQQVQACSGSDSR